MSTNHSVDRRSFLKAAFAVSAGAAIPAMGLTGCASQETLPETGATEATAASAPLTDEERLASITDPAYMGADVNYAGHAVEIGTGKQGQIANQVMIDHHAAFEPHLEKITDRIYSAIGNALSNSTMVIGDTGLIIIDTGECVETANMDLELFRTVTDLPVKAVIYTHTHYVGGTQAYVPFENPDNIPIIAQERFMEAMTSPLTEKSGMFIDRGMTMLANYLPYEGEDGSVGGGTGAFFANPYVENPTSGFVPPNTIIPFDKEETVMEIDGLTFHFNPTVADDVSNINLYIEEENTLITNQLWCVFWNMYTLRGDAYRNPVNNLTCIDHLRELHADNMVSVHGLPVLGRDNVEVEMKRYRDGIQFVYDQTIRFMNKGMAPDEIVAQVKMPADLIEGPLNKPVYGEIEHYVRGVYSGIVGWFGHDPIELHPVAKSFSSGKIVEAMGGAEAVVEEALHVLEDKQYAWAATLATYVLDVDPEHAGARAAKAQACRMMARVTEATNTRHWYMTTALDLEGKLDRSIAESYVTKDKLSAAPRRLMLDMLRVSIVPEKAQGMNESFTLTYTDEGVSNSMIIGNCVGEIIEGKIDSPTAELQLTYPTMLSIAVKEKSLASCIESGEATVVGDADKFQEIVGIFEMPL